MEVHSLGYRTDLFFPKFEGEIIDRGDYLVIVTPSNPNFYWGNFLLFPHPPAGGDFEQWKAVFAKEISARQETHHMVFAWDTVNGETGEVQPFLDAGFHLNEGVVLTARQVHRPPKFNEQVTIRPLHSDEDWEQALQNQMACRSEEFEMQSYFLFKQAQMKRYRQMQQAGLGEWFGAFMGSQLTADLGLFCIDGVGRFQQVETAPQFRRLGICGALVFEAANYGYTHLGAQTLVMVADEHYHAAKIYESIGFQPTEHQVGLEWFE
jgi:ribosomal protein S18 acetylase RimI-like enzyme